MAAASENQDRVTEKWLEFAQEGKGQIIAKFVVLLLTTWLQVYQFFQ